MKESPGIRRAYPPEAPLPTPQPLTTTGTAHPCGHAAWPLSYQKLRTPVRVRSETNTQEYPPRPTADAPLLVPGAQGGISRAACNPRSARNVRAPARSARTIDHAANDRNANKLKSP